MKKIIHMSDIHVGFRNFDERFRNIAQRLIQHKDIKAQESIIVITGDIIDNANKPDNFKKAKATIDFLRENGFRDILIVPGNHDYGTGSKGNKKFVKIFKQVYFNGEVNFPKKDIIDEIAFIGLDSMAEELNWYDRLFAEGQLGDRQLLGLSQMLADADVQACRKKVVYLHHHPFQFRPLHQLKDAKKLRHILLEAMKKGIAIDALLFGHNHEGNAHNNVWGIARCYDAGTATLKPRPRILGRTDWFQVKASVRLIDLENGDTSFDSVLTLL